MCRKETNFCYLLNQAGSLTLPTVEDRGALTFCAQRASASGMQITTLAELPVLGTLRGAQRGANWLGSTTAPVQ
ncbi:unnamed protein product [Boreogadus saida]